MSDLDKASPEQMKKLIMIDDNIDLIRKDLKLYAKEARETIKDLKRQKKTLRDEISQIPLFEGE